MLSRGLQGQKLLFAELRLQERGKDGNLGLGERSPGVELSQGREMEVQGLWRGTGSVAFGVGGKHFYGALLLLLQGAQDLYLGAWVGSGFVLNGWS